MTTRGVRETTGRDGPRWPRRLTFGGVVVSPVYALQRQLTAERRRQSGWRTVCAYSGKAPSELGPGGELVHGPRGAHLEPEPFDVPERPEAFVPRCCEAAE